MTSLTILMEQYRCVFVSQKLGVRPGKIPVFVCQFVRQAEPVRIPTSTEVHIPLTPIRVQITIDKGVVDDNTKLSAADYREMLYRDINNRRKEARRTEQARQSSGRATAPVNEKTA